MKKVFLVIRSGCYDYEPYYNIEIITQDNDTKYCLFLEECIN